MGKRSKGREYALLSLFAQFVGDCPQEETFDYLVEERQPSQAVKDFGQELIEGVLENQIGLDKAISNHLQNWDLERVGNLEKTILRIAVYEMMHCGDTPASIIINEAVSLTQDFADEKAAKFVNGVLSSAQSEYRP